MSCTPETFFWSNWLGSTDSDDSLGLRDIIKPSPARISRHGASRCCFIPCG